MIVEQCDVLIVGGGLVGLSLALGLESLDISYCLLDETFSAPKADVRTLALSKSSIAILKHLQAWDPQALGATPIQKIHVSCEGALGHTVLDDAHDFLGSVVNLNQLQQILINSIVNQDRIIQARFESYCQKNKQVYANIAGTTVSYLPKVIIAADGVHSSVRQFCPMPVEKPPEKKAVLCPITLSKPHQGMAFERFTSLGPMALLPWGTQDMALVLSVEPDTELSNSSAIKDFVTCQLAGRMGKITACGEIKTYPLQQMFMPRQSFQNILFLGNAAHTLHPVAGQGFNLSLRDVAVFLDVVEKFGVGMQAFPMYCTQRLPDQRLTQWVTKFLAGSFNRLSPQIRGLGLGVLAATPMLKNILAFYAQGLGYPLPSWVYQQLETMDE